MDKGLDRCMDGWKDEENQHNLSPQPNANLQLEPIHFFSSWASLSYIWIGFCIVIVTVIIMLNKQSPSYCFSNLLPQMFILHGWISWTRLHPSFWLWLGLLHLSSFQAADWNIRYPGRVLLMVVRRSSRELKRQLENGSLKLSFPAIVHCPKQVLLSKPTINRRRKLYSAHRETKTRAGKEGRIVGK